MQYSVSYTSLVDIARLGIIDFESVIRSVLIAFISKLAMKRQNIVHQVKRELGDIPALALAAQKFPPGHEQVFQRSDIIKDMNNSRARFSSLSLSLSIKPRSSTGSKRDICFG